jgi:hypothetical protein
MHFSKSSYQDIYHPTFHSIAGVDSMFKTVPLFFAVQGIKSSSWSCRWACSHSSNRRSRTIRVDFGRGAVCTNHTSWGRVLSRNHNSSRTSDSFSNGLSLFVTRGNMGHFLNRSITACKSRVGALQNHPLRKSRPE